MHVQPSAPRDTWPVFCNWVCVGVVVCVALAVGVVVLALSKTFPAPPAGPGAVYVTPEPSR